ncbi:hypothetical protein BT96DRAFT_919170, partial [Gymnopus androsaceus JB14]
MSTAEEARKLVSYAKFPTLSGIRGAGSPFATAVFGQGIGYPPSENTNIPEVQEAIKRVLEAPKAAGKYAGMLC